MEDVEEAEEAEEVPLTLQRSRMIVWVARLGDGDCDGDGEAEGGIWTDKISTISTIADGNTLIVTSVITDRYLEPCDITGL